jgi:hypothetical protein
MYSGKIAVPPGGGGIRKIEWNLGKEVKITAGFGILHLPQADRRPRLQNVAWTLHSIVFYFIYGTARHKATK